MRTSLCIALTLLMLIVLSGVWSAGMLKGIADRYVSAAEEVLLMVQHGEWQRAGETVAVYQQTWENASPWLQVLINHEDADGVSMALTALRIGIQTREKSMCYDACAALREYARQLHERDAFTLGNVL